MNTSLYRKFAWTGIQKNKQLYVPYLISGITMAAVFYILSFLAASDVVKSLKGSAPITMLLGYASWAIGLFSIPFLFYTNSTLIKHRRKELGLYNILGMNKKNLFSVLLWETIITFSIVAVGGVVCGIALSKAAELGLVNIMGQEIDYRLYVDWKAVLLTMSLYAAIYLLLLINCLRQIKKNNPVELLHSEAEGERPPKARWLLAVLGIVTLSVGYYLANTIYSNMFKMAFSDTPDIISYGIQRSFYSVGAILIGTFLVFICASVAICKLLQRNKRYYYKTSHFVTVSAMAFRMKRNGASLASICVLITSVIAMFTFTVAFYQGIRDVLASNYPYDIGVKMEIPVDRMLEEVETGNDRSIYRESLQNTLASQTSGAIEKESDQVILFGYMENGMLDLRVDTRDIWDGGASFEWINNVILEEGKEIISIRIISVDDYNEMCGTNIQIPDHEYLFAHSDWNYDPDNFILPDGERAVIYDKTKVVPLKSLILFEKNGHDVSDSIKFVNLVVPNLQEFLLEKYKLSENVGSNHILYQWEWGVNLTEDYERVGEIYSALSTTAEEAFQETNTEKLSSYTRAERADNANGLTGGLMFIMIVLNCLLLFVTALIMYYKQISEGFEDRRRFVIMRKIGMTTREIRKSINSQVLTVFGFPLIFAGVHSAFLISVVNFLLGVSVVDNWQLAAQMTLLSYGLFTIVYAVIYALTSRTYFKIVNRSISE
ncbi:MAG: ABC transporter permease [Clostridia bacterium]|nr:ABC transporter permease [Clostridia bacterium]